jgi:hypothetical protein
MTWKPQLHIVCNRCGKPRTGLRHDCVSNSKRKATAKPKLSFGRCPQCSRTITNPLTHVCKPKSDFKKRKSKHEREQRAKARKRRQSEKHDYQACSDKDCPRPLCVAFKTGRKLGYQDGFNDGFGSGFSAGLASCPGPHSGAA